MHVDVVHPLKQKFVGLQFNLAWDHSEVHEPAHFTAQTHLSFLIINSDPVSVFIM